MHDFTPVSALLGGALIGLASAWLLASTGRIAGVSGILHGLATPGAGETLWRAAFLAGLLVAGFAWLAAHPAAFAPRADFPLGWVAAAGLLVGFGTRMAGGCTSGHGVCGLGRLSARSLVAVLVFLATGMLTTFVVRHLLGVPS
jgi:uncharacterized membrane protein YedE/YeeE